MLHAQFKTIAIEMSGLQVRCDEVRHGLESALMDEGFKFGGSKANAATESANCVLRWASIPENEECFKAFSDELIKSLDKCLSSVSDLEPQPLKRRESLFHVSSACV